MQTVVEKCQKNSFGADFLKGRRKIGEGGGGYHVPKKLCRISNGKKF